MHITTVFFFPFINLTYILSFPVLFAPRRKPSLSRVVIILVALSRRFGINEADQHAFGKAAFERALKTHTLLGPRAHPIRKPLRVAGLAFPSVIRDVHLLKFL